MTLVERKVADRELSTVIPLSIATGLAIESLLGVHPEIPVDRPPVLGTKLVMINLRTLIRNVHGALETEIKKIVTPQAIGLAVSEEMIIIESAINKTSEGRALVVFYACSYQSLKRLFPNALLRFANTDLQLKYANLEKTALKYILDSQPHHDVRTFDVDIDGQYPDTIIITHSPVDLLSRRHFEKLTLLESHTGAFKTHLQWNTKLTNGKDLVRIPFGRMSLQVFGDNGQHFSPMPNKIKDAVKDTAEKYLWTATTTHDKIVYGINKIEDQLVRSSILGLL